MSDEAKKLGTGEFQIDASPVAAFAAYLKEGELQGKRREQKGLEEVIREILANHAIVGARAGVTDEDVRNLMTSNERIATARQHIVPTRKLLGILLETEGEEDDKRHRVINAIASAVDRRAELSGNEDLPKLYAKTREYRSAVAVKAAKTRRKNEVTNASGEPVSGKKSASRRSSKAKAQPVASVQPVAAAQPAASDTPNPGTAQE